MDQWSDNLSGTIRIKNPKTLRRWIRLGWYQESLDEGYTFHVGCGRFKFEKVCTCYKCRNRTRPELKAILEKL